MRDPSVKRPYRSAIREERARDTRRRIRAAGERLFLRDGYLATPLKRVAAEAGVAERTLYTAFATKAELMNEIVRVTVRGHDGDEPLAEVALLPVLDGPAEGMLERFATACATVLARTARVIALAEAAADADPGLGAFRDRGRAAQRADFRAAADALHAAGALRDGLGAEAAAGPLWALGTDHVLYLRLVDGCRWSDEDHAALLARLMAAAVGR